MFLLSASAHWGRRRPDLIKMGAIQVILILALVAAASPRRSADESTLASQLRAKDQALLDAIAPGNRETWDRTVSADFEYIDENNRVINRASYLKELEPLPSGSSGNIAIRNYHMSRSGDTAIVVHYDDETEHYFGSELHAEYLMTETWQLIGDQWKLRIVHAAAVSVDPAAVVLTDEQIDELVGTYRAGTLTYTIHRDGSRIFADRPGRPETELKAEARDVLFAPGQPRSRKVFLRDAAGKVTGFADRRDNRDLLWTRVR